MNKPAEKKPAGDQLRAVERFVSDHPSARILTITSGPRAKLTAETLHPASAGRKLFINCASQGSGGAGGTGGTGVLREELHRGRLLVAAGARRRPKVIPVVTYAPDAASAQCKAIRTGRRIYGRNYLGFVGPGVFCMA